MKDKAKLFLRLLYFQSVVATVIAVMSIVSDEGVDFATLALLLAGMIAIAAGASVAAVIKRVEKLERRLISHANHDS